MSKYTKHTIEQDKQIFLSKSQLTCRDGWSDTCIKLFDVIHDKEAVNPVFKYASPLKLFLLEKIELIETLPEFKIFKEKNLKRRDIRLKVADAKRQSLFTYIKNMDIIVPHFEKNDLIKRACDSYNHHKREYMYSKDDCDFFVPATPDSDEEFISRITTNFLRHKLTNYEYELTKMFGKIGKNESYMMLKNKINSAIFEKYSWINYDTSNSYQQT